MKNSSSFAYIVSQILNKCCVPVAGAGVSLFSKHPSGEWFHKVPWMVNKLKEELLRLRFDRYRENIHGPICSGDDGTCGCLLELNVTGIKAVTMNKLYSGCFFCDVVHAAKQNKLGNLAELYLWEINKAGEEDDSIDPYAQLVRLLRIHEYTELVPTPTHTYIAWLAREGLISEVITTNYDCNFENAYRRVGHRADADVISSLDDYRMKGAPGTGLAPRLKVFKINGCATKLLDGSDQKRFEKILLTERQLQQWRNRQWAADIFKDRLRSRSLFFNGFGSDEPQIHHTLQTVLDEYGDSSNEPSTSFVLDKPTAPIVAIYDPHPSFHQQQIVKTFAQMHGLHAQDGDKLILRHPTPGKNLPADTLWQAIFERVYRQLIVNALEESALAQTASFTAIVPFASNLLCEMLSLFDEADKKDDSEIADFKTAAPAWLHHLTSFNGEAIETSQIYAHLSRCLAVLKDPNTSVGDTNSYVPLNENRALMSELMLLIYLLFQHLENRLTCCAQRGLGFEIGCENEQDKKSLFVSANPSFPLSSVQTNAAGGATDLIILLGQAGSFTQPQMYRMSFVGDGTIKPSTAMTLGWRHIFHNGKLNSIDAVRERLRDVVRTPSNYFYQNQPSLNRRTFLKPV
ncbi:TPA: hypothetical protein I6199_002793 [Vibrio cholerae]|uniref:SIR2 family NAD-dependent protein deacylase n=1 Tax=Vibrio cholerae TaxID=666 RepID=UPI00053CA9A9|nr:SIR2 family protein [Vibrio cholerae]GHW54001.1 SIR2-like domain protein [Vibrio cholerae]HAS3560764.1 hypothetical protein [Vibrio cholerae]HAS3590808.1 hypothetical protein [Vibrio cholerae]HAS3655851.1 hypothetical protein [Vibrio cholerae]